MEGREAWASSCARFVTLRMAYLGQPCFLSWPVLQRRLQLAGPFYSYAQSLFGLRLLHAGPFFVFACLLQGLDCHFHLTCISFSHPPHIQLSHFCTSGISCGLATHGYSITWQPRQHGCGNTWQGFKHGCNIWPLCEHGCSIALLL